MSRLEGEVGRDGETVGGKSKKMEQTVSVIVPVYNCKDYLPKCIESILNQTYPQIQLILIDDGSSDGSDKICDAFAAKDRRVRVIHQKNQGVSAARNAGLDAATGEYLLFVDSDDQIAADTIETSLNGFLDDTIDVVVFGVTKILEQGNDHQRLPMETGIYTKEEMLYGILKDYAGFGAGYPWNKVWRTSAFGGPEGIPRFDRDLYYFEDLEWVIRMLLQTKKANLLPEYLYRYFVRSDSTTNRPGAEERRETGYHQSVWRIIDVLNKEPAVCVWFRVRYYPEIVNGVIHAWKHKYRALQKILMQKLVQINEDLLAVDSISANIKLRCRGLLLLHKLRLL